jgi:hypothetical protein
VRVKLLSVAAVLLLSAINLAAQTLPALPLQHYDYHIPANNLSPITLGMGGVNLTYAADYFTSYDNPALLAENTGTALATSFRLAKKGALSFTDLMSASNLLKDKQFTYYTMIAKNAAWSYQPVASINESTLGTYSAEYYDYQLDKLQMSLAAKDEKYTKLAGGLNIKYLTGRLVYLRERVSGSNMIRESFIDNKVKGVSSDLGLTWQEDKFIWGACFYDILSRLWWEDYPSHSLQRRAALGFEYRTDTKLSLLASVEGKIANNSNSTYHFGLIKNWTWTGKASGDKSIEQNLVLRAGLYSKNFYGTKNINYTLGSGYNYNLFRIDFALTNEGMQLKDSKYLFSVGVGLQ